MEPPHKSWTHDLAAQHTGDNFHSSSWHPLRYKRLAWHKLLFGIQSRRGYSHYATYWSDTSPQSACGHCHVRHNMSVHGVAAYCSPSHPLVRAWIHASPQPSIVSSWRATAHRCDLRITGRLAVPCSLYDTLRACLGESRAAERAIASYQRKVLDAVNTVLADDIPTPPLQTQCIRPCQLEAPHTPCVTLPLRPTPFYTLPFPLQVAAKQNSKSEWPLIQFLDLNKWEIAIRALYISQEWYSCSATLIATRS